MMKVNNKRIRVYLKEIIKQIYDNAFYMQATDKAGYPYITYEYKMKYSENKGFGLLEINVWDKNSDNSSEKVEEIADALENGLNETIYSDKYLVLKFYTNTRTPVIDDNKSIMRRLLVFEMQYYSGEE